jgi:hypothetical protein
VLDEEAAVSAAHIALIVTVQATVVLLTLLWVLA